MARENASHGPYRVLGTLANAEQMLPIIWGKQHHEPGPDMVSKCQTSIEKPDTSAGKAQYKENGLAYPDLLVMLHSARRAGNDAVSAPLKAATWSLLSRIMNA